MSDMLIHSFIFSSFVQESLETPFDNYDLYTHNYNLDDGVGYTGIKTKFVLSLIIKIKKNIDVLDT